jgi:hypothetical protein
VGDALQECVLAEPGLRIAAWQLALDEECDALPKMAAELRAQFGTWAKLAPKEFAAEQLEKLLQRRGGREGGHKRAKREAVPAAVPAAAPAAAPAQVIDLTGAAAQAAAPVQVIDLTD